MDRPLWVTPSQFAAIECNRCGACCERFTLPLLPGLTNHFAYLDAKPEEGESAMRQRAVGWWLLDLEPNDDGYTYRCRRFARDAEGRGVCTQYEARSYVCSDFPYGHPVKEWGWERCSFRVELITTLGEAVVAKAA